MPPRSRNMNPVPPPVVPAGLPPVVPIVAPVPPGIAVPAAPVDPMLAQILLNMQQQQAQWQAYVMNLPAIPVPVVAPPVIPVVRNVKVNKSDLSVLSLKTEMNVAKKFRDWFEDLEVYAANLDFDRKEKLFVSKLDEDSKRDYQAAISAFPLTVDELQFLYISDNIAGDSFQKRVVTIFQTLEKFKANKNAFKLIIVDRSYIMPQALFDCLRILLENSIGATLSCKITDDKI